MCFRFVEGRAYEAIPALVGAKRRLVVCAGRSGQRVQLAWADDLTIEASHVYDMGREIVQATRPDGVYTISAAVPIDTAAAAVVLDLVLSR